MRCFIIAVMASVGLSTGCGDGDTDKDTSGDTISDTVDGVDSADGTSTDGGDTATETTPDTTTADTADTNVDTEDTGTPLDTEDTNVPVDTEDAADTNPPDTGPTLGVVINEISVTGADPDWLELHNAGTSAVNLGGWTLRDDDPLHGYVIPQGTILPAGAYLAIEQGDGTSGFDFGFGDGDGAFLSDTDDQLVDQTVWVTGEAPLGATWGRFPNGSGDFQTLYIPTKGTANVENPDAFCGNDTLEAGELCDGTDLPEGAECSDRGYGGGTLGCAACTTLTYDNCTPHAAALVINEVTSSGDDQIELFNGGASSVQLGGYQLKDAADNTYTFPTRTVTAGSYVVLTRGVEFDFGLGGDDAVTLSNVAGTVIDTADWLDGEAETSFCRSPNGTGGFKACAAASFGSANP